jgi:hypothetical protein
MVTTKKSLRPAAICILLLCVALVSSCGGRSKSAGTTEGGLSIVKVYGINKRQIIQGEELKLSDWYDGTVPSRFWEQLNAELAKNGIKLELDLIMNDQIATSYQTLLAAGKVNDYDFISSGGLNEENSMALITQRRAYPLNKAFDEYSRGPAKDYFNNDAGGQFFKKRLTAEDGNFYWLLNMQADYYLEPTNYASSFQSGMIRVDWLKTLGLEIPKTLDEFYNALVAFQANDMNKNGMKDEVASISLEHFSTGVAQWFGLGWERLISLIDNTAVSPWYQPNVQNYIAYMQRLYRAGVIRMDSEGGAIQANRIGFQNGWSLETWDEPGIQIPPGALPAEFAPFTLQAIPGGPPGRVWQQAPVNKSSGNHFIPAGAKNVQGAVWMLDFIATQAYSDLTELGIVDYNYYRSSDGKMVPYPNAPAGNLGKDWQIISNQINCIWAVNSIFPRRRGKDMVVENDNCRTLGFEYKAAFAEANYARQYAFVQDINSLLGLATPAETARIANIRTDLETYSSELLSSLITGEKNLSQWDSYMADLKRLGLDELIAIQQARADRTLK